MASASPSALCTEALTRRFEELDAAWNQATAVLSSSSQIKAHPAFREVVSWGPLALPMLVSKLQQAPSLWVWAFPEITGEDPIADADRGNIKKMTAVWLRWAREKGIHAVSV